MQFSFIDKKILAVITNKNTLITIEAIVKNHLQGCRIITAFSGKEGIKTASSENPDIIVLDITINDMPAHEACMLLKNKTTTQNIPVAILAELNTTNEERLKLLHSGADTILVQPVNPIDFTAQVNILFRIKKAEEKLFKKKDNLNIKQLKESKRKYKLLFNNAPLSYHSLNDKGIILYINPAWLNTLGYSKSEVIGKWFGDFLQSDSVSKFNENFPIFKRNGRIQSVHLKMKHKKGNYIDILLEGIYKEKPGSKTKITYCVFQDITERKKTENELVQNEEKLRLMLDNSPLGVSATDLKGHFIDVNPAMCNMLGYTKNEILGKHFNEFSHPDDGEKNNRLYKKLINGEIPFFDLEKKYIRKNGDIVYVLLRAQLAKDKNGNPLFEIAIAEDITEKRKTKEIIKEKEENLRLIIENSPIGVTTTDLEGHFKDVNPAFCKMLGYKRNEMLGYHFNKFSHPDDAETNSALFKKLVQKDIPYFDLEKKYLHKNGNIIYGLIRAQVILDNNGKALFQTALIEDVTERKKAEIALKENEQKLKDLSDLLPQAVYETDLKGNLTYLNKYGMETSGYNQKDLESKLSILSLIAEEDRERARSIIENIKNENIKGNANYTVLRKNGSKFPVLIYSSLVYKNEKPSGMRGVIINITEQKRAEQIQKVLFNISNAAITDGNLENLLGFIQKELGKIIDTTNFYVAIYQPELDILTLPFFADEKDDLDYIPPGKTLTRLVLESKKSLLINPTTEIKLAKQGHIEEIGSISKSWLGVPLKIDDNVFGVLAVQNYYDENAYGNSDQKMLEFVSDQISLSINRKKAEDDLKIALEKAKESDRLKSAFLATMSHELRTPLNAIIGFSEFLNKELDSESVESFGKIIYSSGNHLLSIVNDLFDITLIESGATKIHNEETNINSIFLDVDSVIQAKQIRDKKENIDLKFNIPKDVLDFVFFTDPNKIKQILLNLLKNALKFTEEGFVHYGCELLHESGFLQLKFYVKDSGIGISTDKQDIIFELFRQAEDTRTRKYGGTGIGLSVAKRLVELLNGNIWVESEENKGSTFYFLIPVEKAVKVTTEENKNSVTLAKEKLILIVDDDKLSSRFIEIVLKKAGFNFISAKNGEDAIEVCKTNKDIELVLMDINMPVMDGITSAQKIKSINPALPIIAQTAYAASGDREYTLVNGCDDYISKPINQNELLEKIKTQFAKN